MYHIILIVFIIISFFCVYKVFFGNEQPGFIRSIIGIFVTIIFVNISTFTLVFMFTGVEITPNSITTQTCSEIVEFNKSTLLGDENCVITYKTKDGTDAAVAADSNTTIFIKNSNPSEVIVKQELKYNVFTFEYKKIQTYTFQ